MNYSIISSMYDGEKKKVVETKKEFNEDDEVVSEEVVEVDLGTEMILPESPAPTHRVEVIEGVEYLVSPKGKKFSIWSLLEEK